nr:coiled-coil domain-containing protein 78-like [Lytechinus pictus]
MNIDVLARIRPPQRGEGAHNLKIQGSKIKQDETNTAHAFHAIFDDDSTTDTIYKESVSSMVDLVVAGFNCSLLSIGESGSGKSHTLFGDGKSRSGVVHMAVRGIFDQLGDTRERASRNDALMNGKVTISMYEVYNEIIRDLLGQSEGTPTGGGPRELTVNAKKWVHVKELTQSTLRTESDAYSELSRGLNERTQASTDYGRTQAKSSLFVEVTLKMEKEEFGYPHESTFLFVELPGVEKLALNQQELRKKEGAVQNRSISSFGQLISNLSTRQNPDRVVNYSESKVTSLLENAIGGNCKTKAIMHFSPNPQPLHLKTSLIISGQLSRINNYFIMNDVAARALITQYRARLISLQGQLGVTMTTEPARDDVTEDQAKLARDNLKLKEENDYLRRRLDQIQSRFGDIASAKTDLSSRLIGSEEEKLKLSKMLVDKRIENNKLKERGAQENFELRNKVLALENRMIQAESERDRLLRDYRQIRGHFDEIDKERQDVGDRYVYLNADYKALAKKYESEVARNQELGLELLNLLNAEVTLLKQRDNLGLAGQAARNGGSDDLSRVRDIALGLSAERQKVAATDNDRHDLKKQLFGNHDRFRGEIDQMKSHYDKEQDKLQGVISQLNQDVQNMRQADRETHRKLTEAEVELLVLRSKSKELQSANSKLQLQTKEKNEEVRARLVKYLQDIADHIDKSQRSSGRDTGDGLNGQIAAMVKDLKQTYRTRESQLSDAAREYKRTADAVAKKHQQLIVEYRLLKQQLKEKNLPGMDMGPDEDQLTLDSEEVESINRRELTKVMKQLRETETELNKIKREGSVLKNIIICISILILQNELEAERANLLANNSVLEEQLNECQDYIQTHMARYKDEIRRLRRQLGMDDQLDLLGLTDDYGHSRWRDPRLAHVPQSIRKYRTLPEI